MKQKINGVRRILMRFLTQGVSKELTDRDRLELQRSSINKILVIRPNSRLGNQLLLTPLLDEIMKYFPEAKVDLFTRGNLAPILFESYSNIDRYIKLPPKPFKELLKYFKVWLSLRQTNYDLVINIIGVSSSGRLSTRLSKAKIKIYGEASDVLAK